MSPSSPPPDLAFPLPSLPPDTASLAASALHRLAALSALSSTLASVLPPCPPPANGAGSAVNGELSLASLSDLLDLCAPLLPPSPSPPTFVDLGSGRGQCALGACLLQPTFRTIGIELDPRLASLASEAASSFARLRLNSPAPALHEADMFSPAMLRLWHAPPPTPAPAPRIVYCCCTAFDEALRARLFEHLASLPPGTVVVTLTHAAPPELRAASSPPSLVLEHETVVATDWSPRVSAFVYTVPARSVALFYQYVPLADPESTAADLSALASSRHLTGRIRVAREGVNGHLSGPPSQIASLASSLSSLPPFSSLQFKLSRSPFDPFHGELLVRVVGEITACGAVMGAALPASLGGNGGEHLSPRAFHEAVKPAPCGEAGEGRRKVLIDTRNHYETSVGTFRGAVVPHLRTFAQFPGWVAANESLLKGADVYMFCTVRLPAPPIPPPLPP